jgi:putative toxin-antitoxin system antitoxin component (TIGR02293 family)
MLATALRLELDTIECRTRTGKSLEPWEAGRLCWVAQVYFEMVAMLETDQGVAEWMRGRVPALGNVTPLSLLDTPAGYQLVIDTLRRIQYGVFA